MAVSKFGTDVIAGLDSQTAPHLLNDAQLQRADNVNYDVYGAAQPESADTAIATATTPSGIGSAYVGGAQYAIYKDGANALWAVGEDYPPNVGLSITSSWGGQAGAPIKVVQGRGEAIIYDGTRARVWDGDVLRQLGPMVGTAGFDDTEGAGIDVRFAAYVNITGIAESSGAITVQTTVDHTLSEGDKVYIDGVVGMTEINGRHYTVSIVDDDQFTLDNTDGSEWTGYSSGGAVYFYGAGFAGRYKYRVSYAVTLPSDRVIESSPTQLLDIPVGGTTASGIYSDIEATDRVIVRVDGITAADVAAYILEDGSNAVGTDYTVSIRVYRTKDLTLADSEAYYLLHEFAHADAYESDNGLYFYDQTIDADLVSVWVDGLDGAVNSHDGPPRVQLCVPFAGRLYTVDADNQSRIYPSMGAEYDYYGDGWYYDRDTDVVAMGVLDSRMLVVGPGRAWVHTNNDGIGAWDNVTLPDYPANKEAIVETPYGVLLATGTGLYVWDGTGTTMLSAPVKDDWKTSSTGLWHGTFVGDEAVFFNAGDTSGMGYGIKMTGASTATERNVTLSLWRRLSGSYVRLAADTYAGTLIGQASAGFYTLFTAATDRTMTIQGKDNRLQSMGRRISATLDLGPSSSYTATLASNMGGSSAVTFANSASSRRIITHSFSQMAGQFFSITLTGTGTVYGWTVDGGIN
jgi:ribosomal protein S12